MKIVLCCAGGLSTTMLMDAMKAGVKASPKLNESDFQFIAIPVDILDSEVSDAVVLGPQIAHKFESVKNALGDKNIPVIVVDTATYGQMDGVSVLKKVLVEQKKIELASERG